MLVCYPTRGDNPRLDYLLPDGRSVPRMQRAGDAPIFADGVERWPVIAFSHGLGGSPLGSGYLDFIVQFASYGYVVVAPFHGDPRFAKVKLEGVVDVLRRSSSSRRFVAMQAVRPLGSWRRWTSRSRIRTGAIASTPAASAVSAPAWAARR